MEVYEDRQWKGLKTDMEVYGNRHGSVWRQTMEGFEDRHTWKCMETDMEVYGDRHGSVWKQTWKCMETDIKVYGDRQWKGLKTDNGRV